MLTTVPKLCVRRNISLLLLKNFCLYLKQITNRYTLWPNCFTASLLKIKNFKSIILLPFFVFCLGKAYAQCPTTTFNVTGGGSYCAGGSGVTISLDGSESGIDYFLIIVPILMLLLYREQV